MKLPVDPDAGSEKAKLELMGALKLQVLPLRTSVPLTVVGVDVAPTRLLVDGTPPKGDTVKVPEVAVRITFALKVPFAATATGSDAGDKVRPTTSSVASGGKNGSGLGG